MVCYTIGGWIGTVLVFIGGLWTSTVGALFMGIADTVTRDMKHPGEAILGGMMLLLVFVAIVAVLSLGVLIGHEWYKHSRRQGAGDGDRGNPFAHPMETSKRRKAMESIASLKR